MALGLPDSRVFTSQALAIAAEQVFREGHKLLQYAPQPTHLKSHIVDLMAQRKVKCTESEIVLTTGAQQSFTVLSHLLGGPGNPALAEDHTYFGFLQSNKLLQTHIVTVSTDPEEGIDLDETEHILERGLRPAFIYVMPEGHNPLAVSLSEEKQKRLVEIAQRWRVPIIEDDTYGFLQYAQSLRPPLKALDREQVFYVGSFSKIVAPALRVGWIVAPEGLVPLLSQIKDSMDLDTATLSQRLTCSYFETGNLAGHIELLRTTYRRKRDRMVAALRRNKMGDATWREPQAGMFVWLQLTDDLDADSLFEHALRRERLAFVPESAFVSGPDVRRLNGARLNFSYPSLEDIDEGIARLARSISTYPR
jgi:2-aminoadipate transaminase